MMYDHAHKFNQNNANIYNKGVIFNYIIQKLI